MKQSGSCPLDLISSDNEAAVKFITTIPSGVNGKDKLE